jgi:hypothetical protein
MAFSIYFLLVESDPLLGLDRNGLLPRAEGGRLVGSYF